MVHYRLERENKRFPGAPALSRLLFAVTKCRSGWSREVHRDIRKLEIASGITFSSFLQNKVVSPLAMPGICGVNPIDLVESESDAGPETDSRGDRRRMRP